MSEMMTAFSAIHPTDDGFVTSEEMTATGLYSELERVDGGTLVQTVMLSSVVTDESSSISAEDSTSDSSETATDGEKLLVTSDGKKESDMSTGTFELLPTTDIPPHLISRWVLMDETVSKISTSLEAVGPESFTEQLSEASLGEDSRMFTKVESTQDLATSLTTILSATSQENQKFQGSFEEGFTSSAEITESGFPYRSGKSDEFVSMETVLLSSVVTEEALFTSADHHTITPSSQTLTEKGQLLLMRLETDAKGEEPKLVTSTDQFLQMTEIPLDLISDQIGEEVSSTGYDSLGHKYSSKTATDERELLLTTDEKHIGSKVPELTTHAAQLVQTSDIPLASMFEEVVIDGSSTKISSLLAVTSVDVITEQATVTADKGISRKSATINTPDFATLFGSVTTASTSDVISEESIGDTMSSEIPELLTVRSEEIMPEQVTETRTDEKSRKNATIALTPDFTSSFTMVTSPSTLDLGKEDVTEATSSEITESFTSSSEDITSEQTAESTIEEESTSDLVTRDTVIDTTSSEILKSFTATNELSTTEEVTDTTTEEESRKNPTIMSSPGLATSLSKIRKVSATDVIAVEPVSETTSSEIPSSLTATFEETITEVVTEIRSEEESKKIATVALTPDLTSTLITASTSQSTSDLGTEDTTIDTSSETTKALTTTGPESTTGEVTETKIVDTSKKSATFPDLMTIFPSFTSLSTSDVRTKETLSYTSFDITDTPLGFSSEVLVTDETALLTPEPAGEWYNTSSRNCTLEEFECKMRVMFLAFVSIILSLCERS